MANNPTETARPITIRLDGNFAKALRDFQKNEHRHLSISEQVRRALICYWQAQHTREGIEAVAAVLPGYADDDAEFGFLPEQP